MKKAIGILLCALLSLPVLFRVLTSFESVQNQLLDSAIYRTMTRTPDYLIENDAMRVLLCGTSSPLPHPTRAKACVAVFANGKFWIVDTGNGSWNNLALWRIPGDNIGAVLLTHYHSDHIGDLGEFNMQTWVAGRPDKLRVYGPNGIESVVRGFEQAYRLDTGYRIEHHGADLLPPENAGMSPLTIDLNAAETTSLVFEENGLRVSAFPVPHEPASPSVGYRFDYRGRSVVVSGDTAFSTRVVEASRGVDVLVHEAQANHIVSRIEATARSIGDNRIAKIMSDIPSYHTTPLEAAKIAQEANVGMLVMYHLTPPPPARFVKRLFTREVDRKFDVEWLVADDGTVIELPFNSQEIRTKNL